MDYTIVNKSGKEFDLSQWKDLVHYMDDDVRESIVGRSDWGETEQDFLTAYENAHEKAFGQIWELSKSNPVW